MTYTSQHFSLLFMDGRLNLLLKKGDKIELDRFSKKTGESVIEILKRMNVHYKALVEGGGNETIILI